MRNYLFLILFYILVGCQNSATNNEVVGTTEKNNSDTTELIVKENNQKIENLTNEKIILKDDVIFLEYKNKSDSLVFPKINPKYSALKSSISAEKILGESFEKIKSNYADCGCGLTSFKYTVSFENENLISFIFNYGFLGAYPSENKVYKTYVIADGNPYKLQDQFNEEGINFILSQYKTTLLSRIEKADLRNKAPEQISKLKNNISSITIEDLNNNFGFTYETLRLKTDDVFPHAIHALEPERMVSINYGDLKKFRKANAKI